MCSYTDPRPLLVPLVWKARSDALVRGGDIINFFIDRNSEAINPRATTVIKKNEPVMKQIKLTERIKR